MEITPLEKVLQVKCPLHPSNPSDILHVSAKAASHRACIDCILGGDIRPFDALHLRSLFQAADKEDNILKNYPPLGEDPNIYKRLERIQQFSTDKMIEKIEQCISDLKRSFDEIMDTILKDSIRPVEVLGEQRRQVLDLYQSLCEPNKLKEVVIQVSDTKLESRLHEMILLKCQDSAINSRKLQSFISQFEENQQKFSMKLANESSKSLRNISFFTSPITPLTSLRDSHSILREFQLEPSNFADSVSRTVISRKENNQLDVKCIKDNGKVCALISSNALDNEAYYSFRFAFHQDATQGGPQFNIGFVREDEKDTMSSYNSFRYREYQYGCQISKTIKGVSLNSAANAKNVHKEVEMRVHLASRTVKVADFPKYNNVVQLSSDRHIREGTKYCLLVEVGCVNNHITLTDVIVSDGFDNLM